MTDNDGTTTNSLHAMAHCDSAAVCAPMQVGPMLSVKHSAIIVGATTLNPDEIKFPPPDGPGSEAYAKLPHQADQPTDQWRCEKQGSWFHNASSPWTAECLLNLDRPEEALVHIDLHQNQCWALLRRTWAPWLKGRALAAIATKAQGAGESAEAFACFETSCKEAICFGAPLLLALVLQDMLALCPAAAGTGNVASRYEEACFELTMDTDTPLRRHLESREAFGCC